MFVRFWRTYILHGTVLWAAAEVFVDPNLLSARADTMQDIRDNIPSLHTMYRCGKTSIRVPWPIYLVVLMHLPVVSRTIGCVCRRCGRRNIPAKSTGFGFGRGHKRSRSLYPSREVDTAYLVSQRDSGGDERSKPLVAVDERLEVE